MIVNLIDYSKLKEQNPDDIVFDFTNHQIFHNGELFGAESTYSNPTPLNEDIGDFKKGDVLQNVPFDALFTALLFRGTTPEFTITSDKQGGYEVGTKLDSVIFEVSVTPNSVTQFASHILVNDVKVTDTMQGKTNYKFSYAPESGITSPLKVKLVYTYTTGKKAVTSYEDYIPFSFFRRTYFGPITTAPETSDDVRMLDSDLTASLQDNTNSLKEVAFNFTKQRFIIAIPEEQALTSFKDENGIELVDEFTSKIIQIENALGDIHNYTVYTFNYETDAEGLYYLNIKAL